MNVLHKNSTVFALPLRPFGGPLGKRLWSESLLVDCVLVALLRAACRLAMSSGRTTGTTRKPCVCEITFEVVRNLSQVTASLKHSLAPLMGNVNVSECWTFSNYVMMIKSVNCGSTSPRTRATALVWPQRIDAQNRKLFIVLNKRNQDARVDC